MATEQRTGVDRGSRRPSAAERNARAEQARQLRAEGLSWRAAAARLGVPEKSLIRWCTAPDSSRRPARVIEQDDHPRVEAAGRGFVPVVVDVRSEPVVRVTMVSPSGWRVEGVPLVEAMAALARR